MSLFGSQPVPYRANTTEDKQEVMLRLYALWEKYPTMRLGQLIENATGSSNGLYNVEDFILISKMEKFYGNTI